MSEDSSAEAQPSKKSPIRKRPSMPRKKAPSKPSEGTSESTEVVSRATSEATPKLETSTPAPAPAAAAAPTEPRDRNPRPARRPESEGGERSDGGDRSEGGEDRRSQGGGGRSRNRRGRQRGDNNNRPPQQAPQAPAPRQETPINLKKLAKKAWHIYSTEVCEEGLRYIDEVDANKLVRRSFRMAEIFLRYEQQQTQTVNAPPQLPNRHRATGESEEKTPSPTASDEPSEESDRSSNEDSLESTEPDEVTASHGDSESDDSEVIEPPTISVD